MAQGRTLVEILHPEDHINLDNTQDRALTLRQLQTALNGLATGALGHQDTTVYVAQGGVQASGSYALSGVGGTAATGSYALSGVGGTAASNTVTLGGGAGDVEVFVDGTSAGEIPFDTDDTTSAATFVTEWNNNPTAFAKATASSVGAVITMTWNVKGTVGNSKTITATRSAGTATVGGNGTTLGSGAQGAVTLVINGTSVGPVDTTNLSDTASATAMAAAIEANGTLGPLLVAVGSTTNVSLTWGAKGTAGNAITLAAGTSATGTATRSGATLTGGAEGSVTTTVNGTAEVTDTTNLTDAAAATLIASELNANTTINDYVTAEGVDDDVVITAIPYGVAGNLFTLGAGASDTGTATRSGATLTGGAEPTGNFLERP